MSSCHFCIMGRGIDCAADDVAQCDWLHESCRPCQMCLQRPDWSLERITSKLKQLRRVASCEVVAIGTSIGKAHLECRAQHCRGRFMTISKRDASSPCVRPCCRRSTQSSNAGRRVFCHIVWCALATSQLELPAHVRASEQNIRTRGRVQIFGCTDCNVIFRVIQNKCWKGLCLSRLHPSLSLPFSVLPSFFLLSPSTPRP